MKRTAYWLAVLLAAAALTGAAPLLAQPPDPPSGELILLDENGTEILRLAPHQQATGLQTVPAGHYLLRVDGHREFKIAIDATTALEFKQAVEPPPAAKVLMPATADSPVVIDFDLEPGDQQLRVFPAEGPGVRVELQLTAFDLPDLYGWSAVVEYDPEQLQYIKGSFQPSAFVPGLMPLVDDKQEAVVEVGGADFSKQTVSGDDDLGILAFETLSGYTGHTELKVSELKLLTPDGTQIHPVAAIALVAAGPPMDSPGGANAVDQLLDTNACPGCNLHKADLTKAELDGADLTGADLTQANLFRAKLQDAVLVDARLNHANLLQANLMDADLTGADLTDARLISADLTGADLTDAVLDGAKLQGAKLNGAIWVDGTECGPGSVGRCK